MKVDVARCIRVLGLKRPVQIQLIDDLNEEREEATHGTYHWDFTTRSHQIEVYLPTFGHGCGHQVQDTIAHELLHAYQVENIAEDPRESVMKMQHVERKYDYNDNPLEGFCREYEYVLAELVEVTE